MTNWKVARWFIQDDFTYAVSFGQHHPNHMGRIEEMNQILDATFSKAKNVNATGASAWLEEAKEALSDARAIMNYEGNLFAIGNRKEHMTGPELIEFQKAMTRYDKCEKIYENVKEGAEKARERAAKNSAYPYDLTTDLGMAAGILDEIF